MLYFIYFHEIGEKHSGLYGIRELQEKCSECRQKKGEEMVKEEIKKRVLEGINLIPKGHLSDQVIKETIRCVLYGYLKEQGLQPIPAFRNPRFPEGPVDIVGMKSAHEIEVAFCSNPTIELEDIKRLDRVPCEKKFVISFSQLQKKVALTTFYLKPGIEHINIYESEG
jgi:hypothetical protein